MAELFAEERILYFLLPSIRHHDGQFDEKSVQCQTAISRSATEEEFSPATYISPIRQTNVLEVDGSL
jgi:hypothetical protein